MSRSLLALVVALSVVFALVAPSASAVGAEHRRSFVDDDGNVHEGYIEAIAAEGITRGCNPPTNDRFCPDMPVTRAQMAAFLYRALDMLPGQAGDFQDVPQDHLFADEVGALAQAGITKGCDPPLNFNFCPDDPVTRGQMAAFLVRAFDYADDGGGDLSTDDDGSVFEGEMTEWVPLVPHAVVTLRVGPGCDLRGPCGR